MANSNNPQDSRQDGMTTTPLPASEKIYVHSHEHPEVKVGMRTIRISNAHQERPGNGHASTPFIVYDTSGPYTDPSIVTDIRKGLSPLRLDWIKARGDVEEISAGSYVAGNGKNGSPNGVHTERFPDSSRR
ncbi:MAG TPA: hypothetical protein VGA09_09280, partial [Candidatus Binatia bacterium]